MAEIRQYFESGLFVKKKEVGGGGTRIYTRLIIIMTVKVEGRLVEKVPLFASAPKSFIASLASKLKLKVGGGLW